MTTPIERGAEAVLENFHGPDSKHSTWHLNPKKVARAVFESIDVDWLADQLPLGYTDRDPYRNTHEAATAIKAHLLGGE